MGSHPGEDLKGYLAAAAAIGFWSINVIVARYFAGKLPPAEITMWRWMVACCALLPFAIKPVQAAWPDMRRRPLFYCGLLLGMGIFRVALLNTLIYKAGETAKAIDMALIGTSGPIFLALLGHFVLGQDVSKRQVLGYAITVFGVLVLILHGDFERLRQMHFVAGDLWTLGSALCFAIYSTMLGYRPHTLSPVALLMLSGVIGLILVLPFGVAEMAQRNHQLPDFYDLGILAYLGLFPSLVSFFCWNMALERLGSTRAGLIYYLLPVLSSIEAYLLLDETFTASQVLGGLMVLGGVLYASLHRQTHPVAGPSTT